MVGHFWTCSCLYPSSPLRIIQYITARCTTFLSWPPKLVIRKMGSCSKPIDIFDGPDSDLERKTLSTKGKRYSKRGKQPTLLTRTKSKRNYNTRSRRIRKPTELGQEVRLGRNKERSVPEKGKSQSGERNDLRRSTRLKAQKPKDAMST